MIIQPTLTSKCPILNQLVTQIVNVDELDYLTKHLEGFCTNEDARHQVHVVKMLYRPQSQCFQHIQGPRTVKSEGLEILLSGSHFPKPAGLEPTPPNKPHYN